MKIYVLISIVKMFALHESITLVTYHTNRKSQSNGATFSIKLLENQSINQSINQF